MLGQIVRETLDALLAHALPIVGPLALAWSIGFATFYVRYALTSGGVELAVLGVPRLRNARLRMREPDLAQRRMEYRSSLLASAIFALEFLPLIYAIPAGWTLVSTGEKYSGIGAMLASTLAAVLVHDAYFYWTHRWMHRPGVFRRVHAHHHRSRAPSAWAAFSFHPLESLVQGAIYVLLPFVVPMHVTVLSAFVLCATLYSALIHCGRDVFGARGLHGPRAHAALLSTAVDHDLHHGGAPRNFGLYFAFWDRCMGTRIDCRAEHRSHGTPDRRLDFKLTHSP